MKLSINDSIGKYIPLKISTPSNEPKVWINYDDENIALTRVENQSMNKNSIYNLLFTQAEIRPIIDNKTQFLLLKMMIDFNYRK